MAKKSHPSARRSSGSDEPEDRFIARILEAWAWAKQNNQVVVLASVLLVVGVGSGIYYYNYRQDLRIQAAQQFEALQQSVSTANPESAANEIGRFLDRFSDTPYGTEARLLLAQTHLDAGSPEEAISVLEDAARNLNEPLSVDAAFLLAAAYEHADRWDDAESTYLRIADGASMTFQVRQALDDAARIRARSGEYAGAAELYERLLATFEDDEETPERATYRLRLSEVRTAMEG